MWVVYPFETPRPSISEYLAIHPWWHSFDKMWGMIGYYGAGLIMAGVN